MKNKQKLIMLTVTFIIAGLVVFGIFRYLPQRAEAFNPQPDPPGFGMVGITLGQTLRISVVNTAPISTEVETPPDPCRAVMTFRNADGNLLLNENGQPVRRVVLLRAGQSTSLELNADNFRREADGLRLELHPDVRIQQASGTGGTPPDPCFASGEVLNNLNGRTQFLVPTLTAPQRPVVVTAQ